MFILKNDKIFNEVCDYEVNNLAFIFLLDEFKTATLYKVGDESFIEKMIEKAELLKKTVYDDYVYFVFKDGKYINLESQVKIANYLLQHTLNAKVSNLACALNEKNENKIHKAFQDILDECR